MSVATIGEGAGRSEIQAVVVESCGRQIQRLIAAGGEGKCPRGGVGNPPAGEPAGRRRKTRGTRGSQHAGRIDDNGPCGGDGARRAELKQATADGGATTPGVRAIEGKIGGARFGDRTCAARLADGAAHHNVVCRIEGDVGAVEEDGGIDGENRSGAAVDVVDDAGVAVELAACRSGVVVVPAVAELTLLVRLLMRIVPDTVTVSVPVVRKVASSSFAQVSRGMSVPAVDELHIWVVPVSQVPLPDCRPAVVLVSQNLEAPQAMDVSNDVASRIVATKRREAQ